MAGDPKSKPGDPKSKPEDKYAGIVRVELKDLKKPAGFDLNEGNKLRGVKWCTHHGKNSTHDTSDCEVRRNELHMQAGHSAETIPCPKALKYKKSRAEIQRQRRQHAAARARRTQENMKEMKAVAKYLMQ